jgi:hypothetical protein
MDAVEKCLLLSEYESSSVELDESSRPLVESACRCDWRAVMEETSHGRQIYECYRDGTACPDVSEGTKKA